VLDTELLVGVGVGGGMPKSSSMQYELPTTSSQPSARLGFCHKLVLLYQLNRVFILTYVYNCSNVIPQYSTILVQVSLAEATCQFVQSLMVSEAAVVGGGTVY
jgi:hypothetical protein